MEKEILGGFSVGRKPVRCRSDVTLPTPRIIQDGLILHSLSWILTAREIPFVLFLFWEIVTHFISLTWTSFGLRLHSCQNSLNNCTFQPNRVNSGHSGVNLLFKFIIWSFLQADIYQPACPSICTLFANASHRLFAHSVMPQTHISFN